MGELAKNAVFLSYASQDAVEARRICAALRAAGIELWFDQSELRGGDTWDAKIRKQIRECAFFVPIISANTQARLEGYFRLEWKLAGQRTYTMADERAFLLPIVIDQTDQEEVAVPPEFRTVQWTWVHDEASLAAFAARVASLADARTGQAQPVASPVIKSGNSRPPIRRRSFPGRSFQLVIAATVLAVGGILVWPSFRSTPAVREAETASRPANGTSQSRVESVAQPALVLPTDKSIAVLPFSNLSVEQENDFFADGVHQDVLSSLQNIREFRVVSRTSVLPYRTTTKAVPQIALELGVAYLLEGSLRRAGNKIRMSAQLIDARTNSQIWALPPSDRDLSDIFAIQAAIATEIAGALRTVLSPEERRLVQSVPTVNVAAYDLYLKALDTLEGVGGNIDGFSRAVPLLQRAVEIDPNFGVAWGKLGLTLILWHAQRRDPTGARVAEAQAAIDRMERLAPDRPESLLYLAAFYARRVNFPKSEAYLRRAAEAMPSSGEVAMLLGEVEQRQGRFAEALAQSRRAFALDRLSPEVRRTHYNWLVRIRRYEEAAVAERETRRRDGYFLSRLSFLSRGETKEMDAWIAAHPDGDKQDILNWYWDVGDLRNFVRHAGEMRKAAPLANNDETKLAFVLMVLGETERARAEATNQIAIAKSANALDSRIGAVSLALLDDKPAALKALEAYLTIARNRAQNLDLTAVPTGKAVVLTWTGEKDQAIAELARLLRVPAMMNVHEMRRSVYWQPLRGDPRFEALLNDPQNNAPLF